MSGVTFFVAGVPVQQGSKKGFSRKGSTFVQIVDDNKDTLKPWRAQIAATAAASWADRAPISGAVRVYAAFVMPRPKSVKRDLPTVTPDLDKLLRALLDGVGQSGVVWGDDKQVVEIQSSKVYGAVPGVHVVITPVTAVSVRERVLAENEGMNE